MKKAVLYFLLLLFVFQCTSNFWIISSFYINREFIAKELCVNRFDAIPVCKGKCFLDKKLADHQKDEQRFPNLKEKETQFYYVVESDPTNHLVPGANYETTLVVIKKEDRLTSAFLYSIFHPPQTV